MTDAVDLPGVFVDELVTNVADESGVPRDRLASLLAAHQAGVRELPGVENLVYEWRRQFDGVVLDQTETAYYVAAPPWVWDEFTDALDASADEADALVEVHERHVRDRVDGIGAASETAFVVLDRTA